MTDLLLWLDVETTGLNPNTHLLLEVAGFVTDEYLNEVSDEPYHAVLRWDPSYARDRANDFVKNMHDKTGLWDRLRDGKPTGVVEGELLEYVKKYAPYPRQARLAGNSVRLDANFLDEYLPNVAEHLHYRLLDVSSIAFEAYNVLGISPYEKKATHEALSDIRESMAELQYIRDEIRSYYAAQYY